MVSLLSDGIYALRLGRNRGVGAVFSRRMRSLGVYCLIIAIIVFAIDAIFGTILPRCSVCFVIPPTKGELLANGRKQRF
jgi:hypothetical protein